MAAQKLKDSFVVYAAGQTIKTTGYNFATEVDAKGSCFLFINGTGYDMNTATGSSPVTINFSGAGDVLIRPDKGGITGLHEVDATAALAGAASGDFARMFMWDGEAFKEFQFVA